MSLIQGCCMLVEGLFRWLTVEKTPTSKHFATTPVQHIFNLLIVGLMINDCLLKQQQQQ
jgi:hypothetical protein